MWPAFPPPPPGPHPFFSHTYTYTYYGKYYNGFVVYLVAGYVV